MKTLEDSSEQRVERSKRAAPSLAEAARYRIALHQRLDAELPNWATVSDERLVQWLRSHKIKSARGTWFDAGAVKEFRRAVRRAHPPEGTTPREIADTSVLAEKLRLWLVQIIDDHGRAVSEERRTEIHRQLDWIGLTLCEDRFKEHQNLHRGFDLAFRRWRPEEAEWLFAS